MKSIVALNRRCKGCGKSISGRRDKKFCSHYCRIDWNNKERADNYNPVSVRQITSVLLKNRIILKRIIALHGVTKVTKDKLLVSGFNFKYTTHTNATSKGKTYFYCFDYGYLPLEQDWYLIVKSTS